MKKTNQLAFVFFLLFVFQTQALTVKESIQKLKQYSARDLELSAANPKREIGLKVQEALKVLEDGVALAMKEKNSLSPEFISELVRVSVLLNSVDPSLAASEVILPLYKKQKAAFERAFKMISKKERAELEESLKDADRESSQGNG